MEKTTSASAAQVLKNVVQECFVTMRSGAVIEYERHDAHGQFTRVLLRTTTWTRVHDRVHDMGYVAGAITNLLANHSAPQAKQVYAPNVQQHAPVGIKRTHSYQDSRSSQERSWTRVNEQSRVASQTRKLRNVQSMHTSHNFNP